MPRPRWGREGMPDPPPGVRRGTYMSNDDLRIVGIPEPIIESLTPPVSPAGGADVGGVFYPGGRWLPEGTDTLQIRRLVMFDEPLGKSKFRTAKITVKVGSESDYIETRWRRFIGRWKNRSDKSARFAS